MVLNYTCIKCLFLIFRVQEWVCTFVSDLNSPVKATNYTYFVLLKLHAQCTETDIIHIAHAYKDYVQPLKHLIPPTQNGG